jgi:flagellar protein FlaF
MGLYQLNAYKKVQRVTASPRETEARVLTEGAKRLQFCQENWDNENSSKLLSEALRYNQIIWSIFQTELISENSRLPLDLRQNLLRLSGIVDKQIFETMTDPSPEKLDPIININLGLADGLRGKSEPFRPIYPVK